MCERHVHRKELVSLITDMHGIKFYPGYAELAATSSLFVSVKPENPQHAQSFGDNQMGMLKKTLVSTEQKRLVYSYLYYDSTSAITIQI